MGRVYIETSLIKYLSEFLEESTLVMKCTFDLKCDGCIFWFITPTNRHTSLEFHFLHVFTINLMYRDNSLSDSSYDLSIGWLWITTLCEFVWDVSFLPDDDSDIFCLIAISWYDEIFYIFCFFSLGLGYLELITDGEIMHCPEDARWFSREIAELHEDIFTLLGIEYVSVEILEEGELLVEFMIVVLLEIDSEDLPSLLDKK